MQLVVDGTVVAGLKPTEELLALEAGHHVDVALVILGTSALEEFLDLLLELVIAQLVQVVGGVALRLVVAVSIGQIVFVKLAIGRTAEEGFELRLVAVLVNKVLESLKVLVVAIELCNHIRRDALAGSI